MTAQRGELTPRPYARLLTMLSEQLIKNNVVALTELAKNSYDADASWVQIRIGNMKNFGKKHLSDKNKPFVEIEDDGDGMSFETIRDSWMNPASSDKFKRRIEHKNKTRKERIIQGEKGIGRYAVFQIGKKVEIFTRERIDENKGKNEVNLVTDISEYPQELVSTKINSEEPLFLDQLKSKYYIRDKPIFIKPGTLKIEECVQKRKNHGTLIRITELNYKWNLSNIKKIREILSRLQSPFRKKDFDISIVYENEEIPTFVDYRIDDILDEAVLEMSGKVKEDGKCRLFLRNGAKKQNYQFDLREYLKQDRVPENRKYFINKEDRSLRKPECGPFEFKFYVYDVASMHNEDPLKKYIKSQRIYIYRDDIRVYPYGDRDNDWIKLDIYRGLTRAGFYLSNDQIIGYVGISSNGNPSLRDKTNREGLLEQGTAYEDMRFLTLSALNFLHTEFQKIKLKSGIRPKHLKERKSHLYLQTNKVEKRIEKLDYHFNKINDFDGKKLVEKLNFDYITERKIYDRQIEIVEDLAGVGIAVDATSHDVMVVTNRACEKVNEILAISQSENPDLERLQEKIETLQGQIFFVKSLLTGIQPIFRSARRKKLKLRVLDIINTVNLYYDTVLKKINAEVKIHEIGPPLILTSSEGVMLQLFINLMDNSVYWLEVSEVKEPKIEVLIDGEKNYVIFADNGPGVRKDDIDYIFEPFFSTKGIQGRGLGLYIARRLTDKYECDLYYLEKKSSKILPGANFRMDFY